ncbi:VOC family protein [Actinokineospora sp. 24-640]
MRFTRFATVLMVEDVAACRDFFVERLGCAVTVDLGWFVDLAHESDPSFMVDFVTVGHPSMPAALGPAEGVVLALIVDDAEAEQARLTAAGVELLAECRDEPWGQRHFFARSPGPVVEFVQQIEPDAEWMSANGLA